MKTELENGSCRVCGGKLKQDGICALCAKGVDPEGGKRDVCVIDYIRKAQERELRKVQRR